MDLKDVRVENLGRGREEATDFQSFVHTYFH